VVGSGIILEGAEIPLTLLCESQLARGVYGTDFPVSGNWVSTNRNLSSIKPALVATIVGRGIDKGHKALMPFRQDCPLENQGALIIRQVYFESASTGASRLSS
jgi:hypothetical protein